MLFTTGKPFIAIDSDILKYLICSPIYERGLSRTNSNDTKNSFLVPSGPFCMFLIWLPTISNRWGTLEGFQTKPSTKWFAYPYHSHSQLYNQFLQCSIIIFQMQPYFRNDPTNLELLFNFAVLSSYVVSVTKKSSLIWCLLIYETIATWLQHVLFKPKQEALNMLILTTLTSKSHPGTNNGLELHCPKLYQLFYENFQTVILKLPTMPKD
jgi:hypothetical protein